MLELESALDERGGRTLDQGAQSSPLSAQRGADEYVRVTASTRDARELGVGVGTHPREIIVDYT
jgi:hypothetical protein